MTLPATTAGKKKEKGKCKEAEQRGWDKQRIWGRFKKEALKRHFCMHLAVCATYMAAPALRTTNASGGGQSCVPKVFIVALRG